MLKLGNATNPFRNVYDTTHHTMKVIAIDTGQKLLTRKMSSNPLKRGRLMERYSVAIASFSVETTLFEIVQVAGSIEHQFNMKICVWS